MKQARLLFVALISITGCALEDEQPEAVDDSMTGTVADEISSSVAIGTTLETTDNLNLRTGPSTADSVIEVIPAGTPVSVVFRSTSSGGFYHIAAGRKIGWSSGLYLKVATLPAAHTLDSSIVAKMVEPTGSGHDDKGTYYSDRNYWNFCGPGSVTAALSYFTTHATTWPSGYFEEPYGPHTSRTYWTSSDRSRAYLMYIALQVKPPNFTSAGLADFHEYPSSGTGIGDTRDVLNWEASGHSGSYQTFFYEHVPASGLAASTLHHDVARDIYGGHAVVATVDTIDLPNWNHSVGHSIAIIGYDDNAGTYAYVDTCGQACNGSPNATTGGVWHIAQSRMYKAIMAWGHGYVR